MMDDVVALILCFKAHSSVLTDLLFLSRLNSATCLVFDYSANG